MPSTATATTNVPRVIEDALALTGFRWTFQAAFPLNQLTRDSRIQVREDGNVAPREQVARYAAQMAAGATFPPIVVTADNHWVDGNTRGAAAIINHRHDLPAVVVDVNGADPNQATRLRVLAGVLNQHNGHDLTRKELRTEVEAALSLGWTAENISRELGVPRNAVTGIRKEVDALTRMAALNVQPNGTAPAALRAIGDFATLHDAPFTELVQLTKDAGLSATEVRQLGRSLTACGSDSDAMRKLTEERDARREQIAVRATTGAMVVLPPAHRVKMALGQLLRPDFVASPSLLLETRPDRVGDYITTLDQALSLLNTVLRLQREGQ